MRNDINQSRHHDPRINYRGANASRLDNLTDAVFGLAVTLLIFNLANPNSFSDLLTFTKTLPAFLISISFLAMIWTEHLRFAEIYTLDDGRLAVLNTVFLALVIFYVYPLRFLMTFLTNFFFQTDIALTIQWDQIPQLMIYYGVVVFALYFTIFLLYSRAASLRDALGFSAYEIFYTKAQKTRLMIMFIVPLISIGVTLLINQFSFIWASVAGGVTYWLYTPAVIIWHRNFKKKGDAFAIV